MKKLKLLISIILLISILSSSYGQGSGIRKLKSDTSYLNTPHKLRVGLTPSSFINEYLGLQVNGAFNISEGFQFNMELGWIFYSSLHNQADISGFRIRPALRFYTKKSEFYKFHLSLSYNIRKTTTQRQGRAILPNSTNSVFTNFEQDIWLKGLAFMLGVDLYIADDFILDIGFGMGLGRLSVRDRGLPIGTSRASGVSSLANTDFPGDYEIPLVIVNIRLQIPIK